MYKKFVFIFLVVFLSIALLGCSEDKASTCEGEDCQRESSNVDTSACEEGCSGDTPYCLEDTGECVECLSVDDCGENENCMLNECAPQTDCTSDAECGENESCVNNECIADEGCTENTDCSGDTPYCVQDTGECVQCIEDTDCGGGGETCQDNLCTSITGCVDRPYEGFGADTQGGAGGEEIAVTNFWMIPAQAL